MPGICLLERSMLPAAGLRLGWLYGAGSSFLDVCAGGWIDRRPSLVKGLRSRDVMRNWTVQGVVAGSSQVVVVGWGGRGAAKQARREARQTVADVAAAWRDCAHSIQMRNGTGSGGN